MVLNDEEFGEILVRKNIQSRGIRFTVAPDGRLKISAPRWTSNRAILRILKQSKPEICSKLGVKPESNMTKRLKADKAEAMRSKAKDFLPERLKVLSKMGEFSYKRIRFSHAGTRWGSCSSTGTISLNIGLMKLPEKLIDYVLIHELAHTIHMNHSSAFWAEVEKYDKDYKRHRKALKMFTPNV